MAFPNGGTLHLAFGYFITFSLTWKVLKAYIFPVPESLPAFGAGPRARMHSFSPILPLRKSREQRQAERYARKQLFERMKIRGDNRGWQVVSSAGMPTWQWIEGGSFQPLIAR